MSGEMQEGAWRIAARVVAGAPRRTRWLLAAAVAYFAAMTAWIFLALGWRAFLAPQMWGGVLGGMSGLLVGWAFGLFSIAEEGRLVTRWRWRLEPRRMTEMLLALPVMAFVAAVMAVVALVAAAPLALRSPFYLLAVLPCVAVVVTAGRAVSDSTRFLYRHAAEQAELAARARAEAADAQLAALQAQMNPHFLFNALNTVASLVRTDARAAEATVESLASVLRRTLDRSRRTRTTLAEEVDYLRAYLAVEQARFGERLRVAWEVAPETRALAVPPMTLQPLVENALKYGVAGRIEGGRVRIASRLDGARLLLAVEDDGPGFPRRVREGTGLGNLRQRLATLYGEAAALMVETPAAGARVVVEIPAENGG